MEADGLKFQFHASFRAEQAVAAVPVTPKVVVAFGALQLEHDQAVRRHEAQQPFAGNLPGAAPGTHNESSKLRSGKLEDR